MPPMTLNLKWMGAGILGLALSLGGIELLRDRSAPLPAATAPPAETQLSKALAPVLGPDGFRAILAMEPPNHMILLVDRDRLSRLKGTVTPADLLALSQMASGLQTDIRIIAFQTPTEPIRPLDLIFWTGLGLMALLGLLLSAVSWPATGGPRGARHPDGRAVPAPAPQPLPPARSAPASTPPGRAEVLAQPGRTAAVVRHWITEQAET